MAPSLSAEIPAHLAAGALEAELDGWLDSARETLDLVEKAIEEGDAQRARELIEIARDSFAGGYGASEAVVRELDWIATYIDESVEEGLDLSAIDWTRRMIDDQRRTGFRASSESMPAPDALRRPACGSPRRSARARQSRSAAGRRRGSRRVSRATSRGGDSGDPSEPEPALAGSTTTTRGDVRPRCPHARRAALPILSGGPR